MSSRYIIKDLSLGSSISESDVPRSFNKLEYSGDPDSKFLLGNWTVALNLPLTKETASLALILNDMVGYLVVTCTEPDMVDDAMAAFLVSRGVRVYTPISDDIKENAAVLSQVIGAEPHLIIDTNFQLTGFGLAKNPSALENYLYGVLESNLKTRLPFVETLSIPSLQMSTLVDSQNQEWVDQMIESIFYFAYWTKHSTSWKPRAYRWNDLEDTWY